MHCSEQAPIQSKVCKAPIQSKRDFLTAKEQIYIDSWFCTPSKCNFLTAVCIEASWSTPIKRLVYPPGMYGAAIAEGSAIKLKCGIVELAYPSCMKEAVAEDGPALKSCHSTRKCSRFGSALFACKGKFMKIVNVLQLFGLDQYAHLLFLHHYFSDLHLQSNIYDNAILQKIVDISKN